jgi:hypothetical protein
MPADQYLEWFAFDALEPLDPAGAILRGLTKSKPRGPTSWQVQKQQLLQHLSLFGKKKKNGKQ